MGELNLDRGRKCRPNAVSSVHTIEVKILPYRPTYSVNRCFLYAKKRKQLNSLNATGLY